MTETKEHGRALAANAPRPRPAARSLEQIYRLPPQALITPAEASAVAQISETALAVRRTKGEWPRYLKYGRLVRYRLGDVIRDPDAGDAP